RAPGYVHCRTPGQCAVPAPRVHTPRRHTRPRPARVLGRVAPTHAVWARSVRARPLHTPPPRQRNHRAWRTFPPDTARLSPYRTGTTTAMRHPHHRARSIVRRVAATRAPAPRRHGRRALARATRTTTPAMRPARP